MLTVIDELTRASLAIVCAILNEDGILDGGET